MQNLNACEPIVSKELPKSRLSKEVQFSNALLKTILTLSEIIDEAKRLLRYSDKSFTAISTYLGFSSPSHFSKVFKEKTENTPFEYRQMHKHY